MFYFTTCDSPVGILTLASNGEKLSGLWIKGQKYFGGEFLGEAKKKDDLPIFLNVREWLKDYFAGKKPQINRIPLLSLGSEFRLQVWEILKKIPYGEVITYGEIAEMMAEKMGKASMSSQAVGGAVGHNPISIIIPCHRVVGTNGSLTGYAGGLDVKVKLLQLEGVDMTRLHYPDGRKIL